MAQALERHVGDIVHIGPLHSRALRAGRLLNRVARTLHRPYDFNSTWLQARDWARLARPRLIGLDLVFAIGQCALVASLETQLPIVYTSDATFRLVHQYYPFYTGLPARNVRTAEQIETKGLRRASLVAYPSGWAASSAQMDYGVPPERIRVVPYGANLDSVPSRTQATSARPADRCRLLFVGTEWQRKGGDIAIDVLRALLARGVTAELTVVGCQPPSSVAERDHIEVVPRLDKQTPSDRRRLSELYLRSHFLLLPSRADCTPRVCCEASAHGLPSITADIGGLADTVLDGENGYRVAAGAGPEEYAALISRLLAGRATYQSLVGASRAAFEQRLNWDAWARALAPSLHALTATPPCPV
jgi:glycosyltransferase involved in cell wall biosynthesis